MADADFAADLASVIAGAASAEYADPARFFANTYPTHGLRDLLANVCARLSGSGEEAATIFRLDTTYGGGKTHGLIALLHAAGGMKGVANASEFVDPALLPTGAVRIAAFDGENADPANGRDVGDGVLAYTPWGEIAYALASSAGYERVRRSDEQGIAPGAETLRELFGGEPTLILLDELAVYLRKVWRQQGAAQQLTAFLTSLFKAVEGAPNAALVYTLAVGSDGRATDAYSEENQFVADAMAEMTSVSARKATLLNPTQDAETAPVLLRRLFERVDDGKAGVIDAYQTLWREHRESLAEEAARPQTAQEFATSYPFHPDVLATLRAKTSTLSEFQRVRGMLRLLARTIAHLWQERPADATAIHLHHIDLGREPIRQELVTRLGQSAFVPAIANDIASGSGGGGTRGESGESQSLAESIDAAHYRGLPPYAAYAARTTFLHTLAFNEPLKGLAPEHLRYAMLAPTLDISFVEEARKRFVAESAYLDDRPGAPMRFLAEANLNQIIRREERNVDAGEARAELGERIGHIFNGDTFDAIRFPGGPFDVPDEVGDGRPKLIVLSYDAVSFGTQVSELPSLVERIYTRKGADGASLRALRNHLVFVATDDAGKAEMQRRARLRLALRALKRADRLRDLAEHQQDQVLEMEVRSEHELAIAIQQAYRHVLYPSPPGMDAEVSLAHTAIDIHSAADQPGVGQRHIARALRELQKLRLREDEPNAPAYVRDRTPLRKGQMTTLALRDEFRRDPKLPMLIGDDTFIRGIRIGVERGDYVYQRGDLLFGPGDPPASVQIDEQAVVLTMAYAKNTGVWPRPPVEEERGEPTPTPPDPGIEEEREKYRVQPEAEAPELSAEGPLREALVRLWEQARDKNIERIGELTLRLFDAGDAFPLLGVASRIAGADKTAVLRGAYETQDGGSCEMEFQGPLPDAQPVREFLEPQLRAARSTHLEASIGLAFHDGLAMRGQAPEQLAEELCRFASGAAFVSATARPRGRV